MRQCNQAPRADFHGLSPLFTLYLLNMYGGEWLPEVFYEDAFLRAFPKGLSEVAPDPYSTPEKTVHSCYPWCVLVNFAACQGLTEVEPTAEGRHDGHWRVKKRPLLTEAVRFHIQR